MIRRVRARRSTEARSLIARAFVEAEDHRSAMVGVLALEFLYVPLALAQPLPLRVLADNVIGGRPWPSWVQDVVPAIDRAGVGAFAVFAAFLVLAALSQAHGSFAWIAVDRAALGVTNTFRARLFDHLQGLPIGYHERRATGDTIHRVTADGDSVRGLTIGLVPYVVSAVMAVGMAVVLARIDPVMAVIALAPAPIAFAIMAGSGRRVRRGWDAVFDLDGAAMAVVQETFSSIRVVQAFGQESRESERFRSSDAARRSTQGSVTRLEALLDGAVGLVFAVGAGGLMLLGVGRIRDGSMTLGDLLLFLAYAAKVHDPLGHLSRAYGEIQQHLASARRAFDVLDARGEPAERPGARGIVRAAGGLAFDDVAFSYDPGAEPEILRGVRFEISPGQYVGIQGPSGSGKSTLLLLAARFHDPTAGRVLLDGTDLRDLRVADVRRQFALVLQEPVLMAASLTENIAYARPGASFAEIVAAAEAAGARDFIEALPEGFRTVVGERGALLSGGERQRIAIARAFLRDAPILVLDEPTSALDHGTAVGVLEAIERLREGRTTLHVTHRTEYLAGCDLVLEVTPAPPSPWSSQDAREAALR